MTCPSGTREVEGRCLTNPPATSGETPHTANPAHTERPSNILFVGGDINISLLQESFGIRLGYSRLLFGNSRYALVGNFLASADFTRRTYGLAQAEFRFYPNLSSGSLGVFLEAGGGYYSAGIPKSGSGTSGGFAILGAGIRACLPLVSSFNFCSGLGMRLNFVESTVYEGVPSGLSLFPASGVFTSVEAPLFFEGHVLF